MLVPGLDYEYTAEVENIDEGGAAGVIRVFVCSNTSTVPSISALGMHQYPLLLFCASPTVVFHLLAVNMPVSEVNMPEDD